MTANDNIFARTARLFTVNFPIDLSWKSDDESCGSKQLWKPWCLSKTCGPRNDCNWHTHGNDDAHAPDNDAIWDFLAKIISRHDSLWTKPSLHLSFRTESSEWGILRVYLAQKIPRRTSERQANIKFVKMRPCFGNSIGWPAPCPYLRRGIIELYKINR